MLSRIVTSVSNAFDLNSATLSGCVDIIVVRQPDNTLKCTPFHVRFGKTKLLKSREKEVMIRVNGQDTELHMKLSAAGEGQFEETFIPSDEGMTESSSLLEHTSLHPSSLSSANLKDLIASLNSHTLPFSSHIEFALCGHLLPLPSIADHDEASKDQEMNDIFESHLVNWMDLNSHPTLWYHPSLVCRFDRQSPFFPGKVALPVIASWVAFNRPLTSASIEVLTSMKLEATEDQTHTFVSWVFGANAATVSDSDKLKQRLDAGLQVSSDKDTSDPDRDSSDSPQASNIKRLSLVRHSYLPTEQQLAALPLKPGKNSIEFYVTSSFQGSQSLFGSIYLWDMNSRIIVSDIDGTITKSDVLGQLMPIVGRDWSHPGVAELYSRCAHHQYKILYLTSRAIGQADLTRDYIFGLKQSLGARLPHGPLIMSPDRLFSSLKREIVERKPFVFKTTALRNVRTLFPSDYNPFYAGFGNRLTDHRAYAHIGIPESRIFIIDSNGTLHQICSKFKTTYKDLFHLCDYFFPPLSPPSKGYIGSDEQFYDSNYWKVNYESTVVEDDNFEFDQDSQHESPPHETFNEPEVIEPQDVPDAM